MILTVDAALFDGIIAWKMLKGYTNLNCISSDNCDVCYVMSCCFVGDCFFCVVF